MPDEPLTPHQEWLLRMAEKEGNGIISVGGLVTRIAQAEMSSRETPSVDIKTASVELAATFADDRRVQTVIGCNPYIVVYIDHTRLPVFEMTEWRGWPVEIVEHGPMAVMGGDPDA